MHLTIVIYQKKKNKIKKTAHFHFIKQCARLSRLYFRTFVYIYCIGINTIYIYTERVHMCNAIFQ